MTTTATRTTQPRGNARWLAAAWLALAAVVWLASAVDLVRSPVPPVSVVSGIGLAAVMLTTGAIIVLRTQVPLLGWLLVATAATINSFSAIEAVDVAARSDAQVVWLSIIGFSPTGLIAAVILFPTGRATSRLVTAVLVLGVGGQVLSHGLQVASAAGVIGGDWSVYREMADTGVALTVMAALVMHVVTYRRRPRTEQLQLKYLILALLLGALSFLVNSGGVLTVFEGLPSEVDVFLDTLGPGLIPVAIMLAITRYRLYDIDRLVSRTVAYAIVVLALGAVFVGGVALVTALLPTQDRLAVVLTTLAVVALFAPLRRRVTDAVDRRFDRTRYVARQVVDEFGRQVRDVTDLDEVVDRVHAVAGTTLAPATVAVWQPGTGASA